MKITSLLLLSLALISACRKEESVYDDLSPADRDAVRNRAIAQCITESQTRFNTFKDKSLRVFTSGDWQRNDMWKHQLKNGTAVDTTHDIQVWKNAGEELYLVITRSIGSNTPETYFVRLTRANNDELIDDLQNEYCANKEISLSGSTSGPMTVKKEYELSVVGGTREITDTYTFLFDKLAYMGTAWKVTRKIVAKDEDDEVTSTTNLTSELTQVSDPDPLSTNPATYGNKYCELVDPNPSRYTMPYDLPQPSACATVLPAGWDLTL